MWWVANLSDFQWTLHPSCLHIAAFIFVLIHILCHSHSTNSPSLTASPGQSELIISLFTRAGGSGELKIRSLRTRQGNATCRRLLSGDREMWSFLGAATVPMGCNLLGIWPVPTTEARLTSVSGQISHLLIWSSLHAQRGAWTHNPEIKAWHPLPKEPARLPWSNLLCG